MQIEKTVFISYRRTNVFNALAIYQHLTAHGYDVFFDYDSIKSGAFEQIILNQIAARAHFVVLLTPSALERCNEPGDWLRREIEYALELKRNIVPLMFEGFDFKSMLPYLPGKLAVLPTYNGMTVPAEYFNAAMEKLRGFLNIPLELVTHPTPVADVTQVEQATARAASQPTVSNEQLTAEEWFEQGYKNGIAGNYETAIAAFTEAVRFNSEYAEAYFNRGVAFSIKGDNDAAIADYTEAILLNPHDADAYVNRAALHNENGDHDDAITDNTEAIRLNPEYTEVYFNRGIARFNKRDYDGAISDYSEAIRLNPKYIDAYINRGNVWMENGDFEKAVADYSKATSLNPHDTIAYRNRGIAYQEKGDLKHANDDFQLYVDLGGAEAEKARVQIQENEAELRRRG